MRTVTRLFDHHADALDAIRGLEKGSRDREISLISNNAEEWHTAGQATDARRDDNDGNKAGEGAATGAGIGAALGGGAGLLTGLGMLAIPGVGPVVAAGWLAATAAGAAGGALAGGATGGIVGALMNDGESEDDAHVYAEGVRRGGSLVSVRTADGDADEVARTLERHGGVMAQTRGPAYRSEGWKQFDPAAEPYDRQKVVAERARYSTLGGEERSFGRTEPTDRTTTTGTANPGTPSTVASGPASRI
jgi:hypothetical protein